MEYYDRIFSIYFQFAFSHITERFLFKTIKLCEITRFTLEGGPLQSDDGLVYLFFKSFNFEIKKFSSIINGYFSQHIEICLMISGKQKSTFLEYVV